MTGVEDFAGAGLVLGALAAFVGTGTEGASASLSSEFKLRRDFSCNSSVTSLSPLLSARPNDIKYLRKCSHSVSSLSPPPSLLSFHLSSSLLPTQKIID